MLFGVTIIMYNNDEGEKKLSGEENRKEIGESTLREQIAGILLRRIGTRVGFTKGDNVERGCGRGIEFDEGANRIGNESECFVEVDQ